MTNAAVSVTEFKAHCLDLIQQVERDGVHLDLTRHGKVIARLIPPTPPTNEEATPPWLRLRGHGTLHAEAGESMLDAAAFEALRE